MAISKRLRFEVLRRDQHRCTYCGTPATVEPLTIDHVIPIALGGSDIPENLVASCAPCNTGKASVPADAPTVAQVASATATWGLMLRAAADQLVADIETRRIVDDAVAAAWDRCMPPRLREPIPAITGAYLAAGLDVDQAITLLTDAIDRALAARIPNDGRFKYFCGVAWKVLNDLTADVARRPPETHTDPDASHVLEHVRLVIDDERDMLAMQGIVDQLAIANGGDLWFCLDDDLAEAV